jgi:pimeloyl-ACP methyl ester carboxylesterase
MRVAANRRAGWMIASQLLEGKCRPIRLGSEWLDVVRIGEGSPIVLVPGLAGGWRLVAPLAQRMAARHEVIVCGLRGDRFPRGSVGASEIGGYASDIAELIDQLGLERPAVMGVSFGGAVALEIAVEFPHKVGTLIVQGAEARFRSTVGSKLTRRILERFPLPSDNAFVNQFFNLLHGNDRDLGPLSQFVIERCWETDQSVMARRLAALESFDVSDRLWRIDAPTLILAGSHDSIVSPTRQAALASMIPGARFERLEGAGHVGFLTHRAEFARHVARIVHLAKHSPC